jgi:serine/threonine protein kinase, bacterial
MTWRNGAAFAGYTILRLLGSGGMGEVYLAQHPRLPRSDALKILPTDVSADREFRERFNREADLAATLFHPHIVGVHDRGEFDEQLWISMDYIEGTDAAQLMRNRYPVGMPADEVLTIVTAVAGALDYAHQRGLLHRDVKPANILLTDPDDDERRIFLSDFGIARQIGEVSGLTATNLTVATLPYAAPEQLRGADIDGRADQYALAATTFQLLSGAPPYQDSNPIAVISQHLTAAPPKLSDRRPELARLDHVLAKALAKDPAERFSRCREFATALREQLGDDLIGDRGTQSRIPVQVGPGPDSGAAPAAIRRRRPRILLAVALAVAVLTAAGVIGYVVHRKHNATSAPAQAAGRPAVLLDGTYREVFDNTKETTNGAPTPTTNTDNVLWGAFRSLCKPTGCVATVAGLNNSNPQVLGAKDDVNSYRFADGHWQETPTRRQVNYNRCIGENGTIGPGARTELHTKSLEPQPDGTLRGLATVTVLTNECGSQGAVYQFPLVFTRTGDVPPGVAVPDPAGVTTAPTTSTSAPPAGGPVLTGAYRIDYDFPNQTVNGRQGIGPARMEPHWWAFRSSCNSTRCVATGAALSDNNQQEPAGGGEVVQFTDGRWQDTPYLQDPLSCPPETGKGTDTKAISISLQPQPDGSLQGTQTATVLTNECGLQNVVYKTPLVATRIGDVPPAAVLADPALF